MRVLVYLISMNHTCWMVERDLKLVIINILIVVARSRTENRRISQIIFHLTNSVRSLLSLKIWNLTRLSSKLVHLIHLCCSSRWIELEFQLWVDNLIFFLKSFSYFPITGYRYQIFDECASCVKFVLDVGKSVAVALFASV